jgi:hypothetical protein
VNWRLSGVALLACVSVVVVALVIGEALKKRVPQGIVRAGLATLEAPAGEGDALPPQVVASLAANVHYEFTPQDLRRARRVLAEQPGWLVPASEGDICLVRVVYPRVQNGDLEPLVVPSCASRAGIEAGELVEVESHWASAGRPDARVVGIVPDGVTAMDVESTEHQVTPVPVMRNAFEAIVGNPARAWFVGRMGGGHSKTEKITLPQIPVKGLGGPPVRSRPGVLTPGV